MTEQPRTTPLETMQWPDDQDHDYDAVCQRAAIHRWVWANGGKTWVVMPKATPEDVHVVLETPQGRQRIKPGDFIIRDKAGEFCLYQVPARTFVDDLGRRWEWCGGQPETWAWRITGPTDAALRAALAAIQTAVISSLNAIGAALGVASLQMIDSSPIPDDEMLELLSEIANGGVSDERP
ncbi:hypothetical protein VXD82_02045 [Mycobacteroides chelonae]|uniref:hypothetical protein n=1 Tax=Mycobacteroides chelonae TaxID=1774 RepID=UPI0032047B87